MASPKQNPAALWDHDRRIIANWLLREAAPGFDGAEIRGDGSSFIQVPTPVGPVSVQDYWSFARLDFQPGDRRQSYLDTLRRQSPILSIGYTRPGAAPSQFIAFFNGELNTGQGFAEAFAPFAAGKKPGELVAVETRSGGGAITALDLYADPFLVSVLEAIRNYAHRPPGR